MIGPLSAALAAEAVVVIAIVMFAAVITNADAISAFVDRLGWF